MAEEFVNANLILPGTYIRVRSEGLIGVAGIFIETHQNPGNAPSDGPNMVPLDELEALLIKLMELDVIAKR